MIKIIMTKGIPGSGKSFWSKKEISKDPLNWIRVNNDEIRQMLNSSVFNSDYEKSFVIETRKFLITQALKKNKSVIVDNVNANKRNWEEIISLAKDSGKDVLVTEKPFYISFEEAIERDSKREGKASVGKDVIEKFWKELGKESFKYNKVKQEFISGKNTSSEAPGYIEGLPEIVISDLDGTLSLFNKEGEEEVHPGVHFRNPYDASSSNNDAPNWSVIETIKAHYLQGRKIIFVSGRENKYREQTIEFIEKYVAIPMGRENIMESINYELFMRKTDDNRKDSIIKEEIYNNHIKGKYNVLLILDDRKQVVSMWRQVLGLTCFQVAEGNF